MRHLEHDGPKGATCDSNVQLSRTIDFESDGSGAWTYGHSTHESAAHTTATVRGPRFNTRLSYNALGAVTSETVNIPGENVDLQNDNITLRSVDVSLPVANGLALEVLRVYNSNVATGVGDPGNVAWHQSAPRHSWAGAGWSMHIGGLYVHNKDRDVTIEFPDGHQEKGYRCDGGVGNPPYVTKSFLKVVSTPQWVLFFQDGARWLFDDDPNAIDSHPQKSVLVVRQIANTYGDTIDISYLAGRPVIDTITDCLGRTIEFIVDDRNATRDRNLQAGAIRTAGAPSGKLSIQLRHVFG